MSIDKKTVTLAVANQEGEISMEVNEIMDWTPTKISYIGQTAYFKHEDTFYSMSTSDFKAIFAGKINK